MFSREHRETDLALIRVSEVITDLEQAGWPKLASACKAYALMVAKENAPPLNIEGLTIEVRRFLNS